VKLRCKTNPMFGSSWEAIETEEVARRCDQSSSNQGGIGQCRIASAAKMRRFRGDGTPVTLH
jgi:hypothetical protein